MMKGLSRSVMGGVIIVLIALGFIYLARQKEGFATDNLALVGIKLKTSLAAIKTAFENAPQPILLTPDNLNTMLQQAAKGFDMTKFKLSIVEGETGNVVWDPAGDFTAGKPISPYPSSSDVKSYILYINFLNLGIPMCINTTACYGADDMTVQEKYRGMCVNPDPACRENALTQSDRDAMEKITPSTLSQLVDVERGLNTQADMVALHKAAGRIPGYVAATFLLGSFKEPVTLEGYIYEPPLKIFNHTESIFPRQTDYTTAPTAPTAPTVSAFTDYKEGFAATTSTDIGNLVTASGSSAITPTLSVGVISSDSSLGTGSIIGITLGVLAVVGVIAGVIYKMKPSNPQPNYVGGRRKN